jgi:hypothetical protein
VFDAATRSSKVRLFVERSVFGKGKGAMKKDRRKLVIAVLAGVAPGLLLISSIPVLAI